MKVAPGEGHIEVRDIPYPTVANPDDVLIRVCAGGVCGTDLHIWKGEFTSYPPVVLGHEFSGTVEAVGEGVAKFKPGDRVVGEPHTLNCGKCKLCREGKIHLCPSKRSPGWGINGAFADALVMPELYLHKVPDSIDLKTACLIEPMAISVTAVIERGTVEAGDVVAVIGAGPIGLLCAVAALSGGAKRVFILGTDADEALRFNLARKMGFRDTINVQRESAKQVILDATGGIGADLVIEASGSDGGIRSAADIARVCGRIAVVGMPGKDGSLVSWLTMVKKCLDVRFSFSSSVSSWPRALSVMETTACDLRPLITREASIDDWESVFNDCAAGREGKAAFVPSGV